MELKNEIGKLNFVLALFTNYGQALTGGIVAMHQLAHKIALRGHNVYIFCEPEYPHENIHTIPSSLVYSEGFLNNYQWEGFSFSYENTIAIYPQIQRGNPFNTIHVVRWILYDTEKEIEKDYGKDDVYFNFGNFKTFRQVYDRKLTIFDYNFEKLYQTNFGKRKGFCHIIHKHTPPGGQEVFQNYESFDLTNWKTNGAYNYLREQLNQYEYFLTYDQKSFYTLAAGLCGCKSIILNSGPSYEFADNAWSDSTNYKIPMTPTEYRLNNPIQMFGTAYGWNDIQWANKTINMVKEHLLELEKIDEKSVDKFLEFWKTKLLN